MFTKNESGSEVETIIGPSVNVEGSFTSQGNVRIEGSVNGSVATSGALSIGEQAHIAANIQATNAYVAGYVKGNIQIKDRLELASTSRIDGDISTKILMVAEGAQLTGKCQMTGLTNNAIATVTKNSKKSEKTSEAEA
ncbi:polymer-forming cytoskeletal protein [Patescibacteria group bacterium]|nr:polymer-forming cytoskeletal protein [Patescibacteria group bacterium]